MSGLEEEKRITCPKCGKLVPAMIYCIYCGTKLPKITLPEKAEARPVSPQTRVPPAPPYVPPQSVPPAPPSPPTVKISPPPVAPPEVKSEILNLMSEITKYYERKVSLLSMFISGEVSERIFLKLYDEYNIKLNDLLNLRARKLEDLKNDFEGKSKRLEDIKVAKEELEVRYKIGEIAASKFSERIDMLKMEESKLQTLLKEIKMNLDHMGKLLAEKTPREVLDLDTKARSSYEALNKRLEEGKLTEDVMNRIKPDLEKMLEFFNSLIGERKEKEARLREHLETLQARYRVSEISVEEYERKKRELQEQIDKVWT